MNKRGYKAIGASLVFAALLLAFAGAGIALSIKRAQQNSAGQPDRLVYLSSLLDSYSVYPASSTVGDPSTLYFDSTPTSESALGHYSLAKKGQTAFLVDLHLSQTAEEGESLFLSAATSSEEGLLTLDESGKKPKLPLKEKDNPLSSIVTFYSFVSGQVSQNENGYSLQIKNSLNKGGKKKGFYSTGDFSKQVTLAEFVKPKKDLFVVVDYDEELIQSIYSLNLDNPAAHQNEVTYAGDFDLLLTSKEIEAGA